MKKFFILMILVGLMIGCGVDGKDGKAYLRITWDWYVDSYSDNNSDTPYNIYDGTYYETAPGSYSYSYDCSDGIGNYWSYSGTYTITVDKGEKAGLFADGEDGEDSRFTLYLTGYKSRENSNASSINKSRNIEINRDNEFDLSLYEKVKIDKAESETFYSGDFRIDISRQMFQHIKK